jgi:hypothetical protein
MVGRLRNEPGSLLGWIFYSDCIGGCFCSLRSVLGNLTYMATMIDKDMVMACVLAQLQAEGKTIETATQEEISQMIAEAIADLRMCEKAANAR